MLKILILFIASPFIFQLIFGINSSIYQNVSADESIIPAFPGAEGFGATSIGGRGGKIIEVTNLNDSGPGSLRSALKRKEPRIVVFKVAGIITLKDAIRLNQENSFLTIAGQTAPGGGIIIRCVDNNIFQIQKGAHDIIIRYLRLRNGSGVADGHGHDNLTISGAHNIIADHLSMSWSTDENVSLYRQIGNPPVYNITIQRSIMAEGLAGHSNGMIVSGKANYKDPKNPVEEWRKIYDVSVHHNLFIHNTHRNPRVTAGGIKVVNNVTYNWKYRIGSSTRGSVYDNIANYSKAGPMSNTERLYLHESFSPLYFLQKYPDPSIYTLGNVVESIHENPKEDDWDLYQMNFIYTALPPKYRRFTPLKDASFPVKQQSAQQAYYSVLEDVGANARLDCYGNWVPNIDDVDLRLFNDVKNNSGPQNPIKNVDEVGGYPFIDPGMSCVDEDHDGMPDIWEMKNGFDPKRASDSSEDADGDGYTNIEEYLNGQ